MLTERQPAIGCRGRLWRKRRRVDACVGRDDASNSLRGTPLIVRVVELGIRACKRWCVDACMGRDDAANGLSGTPPIYFGEQCLVNS